MKIRGRYWNLVLGKLCLLVVVVMAGSLMADKPPIWQDLEPGPYAIGFRTIEKYDHSRAFAPKRDYFGQLLAGERARPMQTCIWYPAAKTDAAPMVYGEYSFPYPQEQDFFSFAANVQGREVQVMARLLRLGGATIQDLMNIPMAAVRDAPPQEGTFPLIIYHPNLRGAYSENALLCEYLASQGYIVATTHPLGLSELTPTPNPAGLETAVRDLEFALATMHDIPQVDHDRLGLLGYAQGASTALLMQMHNTDVDAVACLDGAFSYTGSIEIVQQSPFFDVSAAQRPLMQIYRGDDSTSSTSLTSSLKYSDEYLLGLGDCQPIDFCSYSRMSADSDQGDHYGVICQYVRNFFDGFLKSNGDAPELLEASTSGDDVATLAVTLSHTPAEPAPPNERQFLSIILDKGVDTALAVYEQFKSESAPGAFFNEGTINAMGYGELQRGNVESAVKLFKLNTEAFPQSLNTWDSLGDAYMASNNYEHALECARKTLEMIESDTSTDPTFKEQIKRSAEHKIQEIETQKQ